VLPVYRPCTQIVRSGAASKGNAIDRTAVQSGYRAMRGNAP
jgi:hypothetical protein